MTNQATDPPGPPRPRLTGSARVAGRALFDVTCVALIAAAILALFSQPAAGAEDSDVFDIRAGHQLSGSIKKTLKNTALTDCLAACLSESAFACAAVDHAADTDECRLATGTKVSANAARDTYVVAASRAPKRVTPRSAGLSQCWSGAEQDGLLCYKNCRSGYNGQGPVCWEKCPAGYKNDGATCRKPVEVKEKKSYGRGAGRPMGCAPGEEKDGALCYPKCKAGYNGVGPVCWQNCPSGFRNDGAYCGKPKAYGRGVGKAKRGCEKKYGKGKCEKNAGLWYQKCREGFHNTGCCICSPDCPSGMKDIGVSCQKKSYTRTAGKPLSACGSNEEKDGALCYPKCKAGYNGVGPVCWENCPAGYTNDGATCRKPGDIDAKKSYGRGAGWLKRDTYRNIFRRYIRDHHNMNYKYGKPLTASEKAYLKAWFPERLLNKVRIRELAGMTGAFSHKASATTYGNDLIVVKKGKRSNELLRHEMVHVCQYDHLGRDGFAREYADQYVDGGYQYRSIIMEEDAYGFDAKTPIHQYRGADGKRAAWYRNCKD